MPPTTLEGGRSHIHTRYLTRYKYVPSLNLTNEGYTPLQMNVFPEYAIFCRSFQFIFKSTTNTLRYMQLCRNHILFCCKSITSISQTCVQMWKLNLATFTPSILDRSLLVQVNLCDYSLPLCFPSLKWAFLDDLNVSKNFLPFCSSTFFLALSHLCSEAKISMIRGKALPAASVSRKAKRHLLATKSTADSQYSWRAQYATSASKNGYPWASRFPKPSF